MDDRQKLIELLSEINDEVDFENETALVDDGLIDSLELTEIISGLNTVFGVRIPARDIEPENFNSVDAILELVDRYRG